MRRRRLAVGCLVALLAACGGADDGAVGPAATLTRDEPGRSTTTTNPAPAEAATTRSSTTTAAARSPEQQVEQAYLRSWDVWAEAALHLDPERLEEVFAGEVLGRRRMELAGFTGDGTPARIDVEHRIESVHVEGARANVLETYANHSVLLDGSTGAPIEADPNTTQHWSIDLERIGGKWKVIFITDLD